MSFCLSFNITVLIFILSLRKVVVFWFYLTLCYPGYEQLRAKDCFKRKHKWQANKVNDE